MNQMEGVIHYDNGVAKNHKAYEWKSASVTAAGTAAATNLKSVSGFTTLFDTVGLAHYINVVVTADTWIALNSASNDVIKVTTTTPYTNEDIELTKLFVSTNGGAATVTVSLH